MTEQQRLQYLKRAMRYCRKQYNQLRAEPYSPHCSHDAAKAMQATESKFPDLGTFGVEGFCFTDSFNNGLSYLNTGDMYEITISFRSDTEQFRILCVGDFIENNPKLCGDN